MHHTHKTWMALAVLALLSACAPMGQQKPLAHAIDATSLHLSQGMLPHTQANFWHQLNDPVLNQLLIQTLSDAPDLAATRARIDGAAAQYGLARSQTGPQIAADATYNRQRFSEYGMYAGLFGGQYMNSFDLSLKGAWEFDFWGKHRAQMAAAIGQKNALEYELEQTRLMLAQAVLTQYIQWQNLLRQQDILQRRIAVQKNAAGLMVNREHAGLLAGSDVYPLQMGAHQLQAQVAQINGQIDAIKHTLAALSGQAPDALKNVQPTMWKTVPIVPAASVTADLLGQRPDIAAQRAALQAASENIKAAKAEFYPNVKINGLVGLSSIEIGNLFETGAKVVNILPAVTLPIFNSGALKAQLAQSHAQYDLQAAQYNKTVLTALREAADALSDGQATAKQSQERLAAWQLLQKASNAKAARVRAGLDNKLSTWQNQDDALAAEGLYQNALTAQRLAWVNTQITLGGGFDAAANHTESAGK